MKSETIRFIKNKYGKNSAIYKTFDYFYWSGYLSSFVIDYTDQMAENNKKIIDKNLRAENESLVFPKLSNGIFLTLYSDFEFFLIALCKAYKESLNLRLKYSDLAGDGIIGALFYLDRVADLDVKNNAFYPDLTHWNRIRNYLVHNSGIIEKECEKSVKALNLDTAFSLENEVISLRFQDLKRFIQTTDGIQEFLIKR